MGAASSLALAGLYPDLPGAILLEDPPAFWMPAPPMPIRPTSFSSWIVPVKRLPREELIERARKENPGWQESELGPWADSKLRLSVKVLTHTPGANVDWAATVQKITCPVLLITADAGKAIVTPEAAAALQKLVPQTKVVNIPGAGHSIRRDQFAPYMTTIRSFLAQTL